jgi:hypothetical protein
MNDAITTLSTTVSNLDGESEVGSDSVDSGASNHTITFGQSFSSAPTVMGMLKNSNGDPIVAVQLSGVSTTEAVFIFSDDTPSANYSLDYIASL